MGVRDVPLNRPNESYALLSDEPSIRAFLAGATDLDAKRAQISFLAGGVSSIVVRVTVAGGCYVIKQALKQLRVSDTWYSRPERSQIEARCAQALARLIPGSVPEFVLAVAAQHTFVMRCAEDESQTWKDHLMRGEVDGVVASAAGLLLARIHSASLGSADLATEFGDRSFFRELRVDPYLRQVAVRHPDLDADLTELISDLDEPGSCLVHGDYSPKNLLVQPTRGLLLVDHEVAHWGQPAFDVAFVVSHLCLKAVRFRARSLSYLKAASALVEAYRAASPLAAAATGAFCGRLLGGLMLARVDGKSPVEYLTDPHDRELVRVLAREALLRRAGDCDTVIAAIARAVASG